MFIEIHYLCFVTGRGVAAISEVYCLRHLLNPLGGGSPPPPLSFPEIVLSEGGFLT